MASVKCPEIQTIRLRMREWRAEDRVPLAAMHADPEVMRYFPATLDRAASDAACERWIGQWEQHGLGMWSVETLATGEWIGCVGLLIPRLPLPCGPAVEVGWRLARGAWGRGYASEAASASLDFGFERLGLAEIIAITALSNERSRRVMERIGMSNSGQDFDHPAVVEGHPLRRHCLYRVRRTEREDAN